MRLLILSDSHRHMDFMERCVEVFRPDCVVHLGDYYPDGFALRQLAPNAVFCQVPGNCDEYGCDSEKPRILVPVIGGVRFYMTHGHLHRVKQTLAMLLRDARAQGAQVALYGHTHIPDLHREPDGLLVMNPGAAGFAGSAGVIEVANGVVEACRLVDFRELEDAE